MSARLSKTEYEHRMIVLEGSPYYEELSACRYCGPDGCDCVLDPTIIDPTPEQVAAGVAAFLAEEP